MKVAAVHPAAPSTPTPTPGAGSADSLPLRRLVRRTHLPAMIGFALSLVLLLAIALVMTLRVQPHLNELRHAADAANRAHDAMLDQETGVRGYLASGAREFLEPYNTGSARRADADAELIQSLRTHPDLLTAAIATVRTQQSWEEQWATPSVHALGGPTALSARRTDAHLRQGKVLFDAYRAADTVLQARIAREITAAENTYRTALGAGALMLGLVGLASLLALLRGNRRLQRNVVAPIRDLTLAVGQVAGGDLRPHPVALSIADEVGALSDGVATMTVALDERTAVAEQREQALVRHGQRLEHVLELSRGLSESLSLRYTSLRLIEAVRTLSGADQVELWLRSRDHQELVRYVPESETGRATDGEAVPTGGLAAEHIEVGIGAVGRAARYGRTIPLDERRDSRTENVDATGLAIPLIVGTQVIAVLAVRPPAHARLNLDLTDALILQGASALQAAQLHSDVEEQSRRDALTSLANRRQFDEDLAANVARSAAYGRPLALMMIDLDHFKQINDTYGHPRGDEVLQDVAGIITRQLRDVDTAYRYGGEELCILMPEADSDQACEVGERVRARVEASFPWATRSPVTLSAGVASLAPGGDGPALVGAADRALYAAKRNGRNRVECG